MKSALELWDEAKHELGYDWMDYLVEAPGCDDSSRRIADLAKVQARQDYQRYEDGYDDAPMELHFDVSLENLSHQIARETGHERIRSNH